MANIAEFTAKYANRDLSEMTNIDKDLKEAFHKDAKAYLSDTASWLMPSGSKGRRGMRSRYFLSCLGHVAFSFEYIPKGHQVADTIKALGWSGMVTPAVKKHIARTGALSGSFAEACETLVVLASIDVTVSRVRGVTLEVGKKTFKAQENGTLRDIGSIAMPPTFKRRRDEKGLMINFGIFVGETMVILVDGTGAPCTHADTAGVKGKNQEEAGTRELKVAVVVVYTHVDWMGRPITNQACTSYMVTYKCASDLIPAVSCEARRRGHGRIQRVQVIGDGADWIRNLWRQAFGDATLTLDFYHACEYLFTICKEIFETDEVAAGFKKLKAKLMRYSGATLMRFLEREHADELAALSKTGLGAVNYLTKRVEFMNYRWLRKEHYYIGSGSVESACKFLVAARCKQAGMHWRHKNAAYVTSVRAALRSNRELLV